MIKLLRKYGYYLYSIIEVLAGFSNPALILRIFMNTAHPERRWVQLRKEKLEFKIRSAMDVWSLKETFIDRFYERFGTKIGNHWTIIDIGGGIGEFTLLASTASPENMIYALEPFHDSFQLLQENLQRNDARNVKALPLAVSAETGTIYLEVSEGEPLQFHSGSEPRQASSLAVPSISLADMFAQNGIETCDLLKLDCEGAEYPILLNTPSALFARIHRIILEYHSSTTSAEHVALVKYLEQAGYRIRTQPNYVHANLGYLYAFQPGQVN